MNSALILDGLILTFVSLGFLISIAILLLVILRIRPLISSVPLAITCNTYLSVLMCCTGILDMYGHSLYGDLNPSMSFDNRWCQVRAYFLQMSICALFYSYVIQAVFQFCQVVHHKMKRLRSLYIFIFIIIFKWFLAFLLILPVFLLNGFEYISNEYHCQIPFIQLRSVLYISFIVYFIPLSIVFSIYIYIIRYVRRMTQSQRHRQHVKNRDLVILKRILLLTIILVLFTLPVILFWLIYIITNYLIPYTYRWQWLAVSFTLILIPIGLALATPQIIEIITLIHTRHVFPSTRREERQDMTLAARQQAEERF